MHETFCSEVLFVVLLLFFRRDSELLHLYTNYLSKKNCNMILSHDLFKGKEKRESETCRLLNKWKF